ncbi:myocardial zonula adherens protein-like isoform X1 [Megalops cyprinoides]|uniref:myocardial zonula adherens protein-like isoform X1 n=1 Tax=Megalops cyprinoides TaxID=118141 RepID=UPI0018654FB8|nr:myocardial zonula adherens protein-like isoform X1 [Megalops cyprinoides]
MLKYGSGGTVTTTANGEDPPSQRRIRRLRLTLHSNDPSPGQDETQGDVPNKKEEKAINGTGRRKNGYMEPTAQHLAAVTNGVREKSPQRGTKAQRTGADSQQEVMACEWSVNHLRDQMNYIREVRDSLEKVRERMYGQFGGMQQSMSRLSQDIRSANAQRQRLESEVRVRTAAMESFEQMNSSLISANIDLQKSLLQSCAERVEARDKAKSQCSSCQQVEEKLREREKELAAARAENQTLRLQVEASQEANSQALREVTQKLQSQHKERLQEEQRKHVEEIEALQAQIDEYLRKLEEAEKNARIAEAKIAERDQRISEVERLLDCMAQEKGQLQQKLEECETRLSRLRQTDQVDATTVRRSQQLEEEASELRERIKHLNDMVFCQQRKVKGMIEEVEMLRSSVVQKDLYITELLDRIAIIECENNELEDKLKYFMSMQNESGGAVQTRDIGVGCDLPVRPEPQPQEEAQSRLPRPSPLLPSRIDSSLLKYSPLQYSSMLKSNPDQPSRALRSPTQATTVPVNPSQSGSPQHSREDSTSTQTTSTSAPSSPERPTPAPSSPQARSSPSRIYTPYMRLMEITAKMNIE